MLRMSRLFLIGGAAFVVWSVLCCSNMSSSSYCMGGARSLRGSFVRVLEEVAGSVRARGSGCISLVRSHVVRGWCVCVVLAVVIVVLGCGLLCS